MTAESSDFREKSGIFRVSTVSGGKDSTAMLILMIEKGMPLDCVINADTGMEFPEMYEHLAKLDEYLFRERGIHITTLRHPKGFEYLMFDQPKVKARTLEKRERLGLPPYGNGWPGIKVRWCTGQLKTHLIEREVRRLKREKDAVHYVGIAADEAWRIGASRRRRLCKSAMTGALISAGCTKFTAALHAGAVPCNAFRNCAICGVTIRNSGNG